MMNRREFAGTLAASAWTAKSYAEIKGSNDRLNIGVVGCGGMAGAHMNRLLKFGEKSDNFQIIAVCDLYDKRRDAAATLTGGKPFANYHDLLAQKDVDYILNATPEHWHSRVTIAAIEAGKHVYNEKPMARTVEQAKAIVAKAKAH